MILDEAIKHAEEVSSRKFDDNLHCIKCAEKHRQFAEWLKDYKRLLEQEPILDKIRAEVEQLPITDTAVRLVTDIIDKYRAESGVDHE